MITVLRSSETCPYFQDVDTSVFGEEMGMAVQVSLKWCQKILRVRKWGKMFPVDKFEGRMYRKS